MVDLTKYYPDIMKEVREFKKIANAENIEIDQLWETLENVMKDQFVYDSTENGVTRWEKILKITPKGTDDLEIRKLRILARLNENIPYTYRGLEGKLKLLCGEDGYQLSLANKEYTLVVRIKMSIKKRYDEVNELLKRMVPANLIIDLSLLYNTYSFLEQFTYNNLEKWTYDQLRNAPLTNYTRYSTLKAYRYAELESYKNIEIEEGEI